MGLPKSGENSTFNYLINLINLLFDFLINDIKIYRVKVIWAKDGDSWTTQGWEIIFFRKNIGMFKRFFTNTYMYVCLYKDIWKMLCVAFQSYTTDQNNYIGGVYMNLKKPGYKNLVWPLVSRFLFFIFLFF